MKSPEKDRKFGDPASIGPRGKNRSQRKSSRDPGFTPSEQRKRDQLMRQFTRLEGPSGNSEAYLSAPCWCECGRLKAVGWELCASCLAAIDAKVRAS